MEITHVSANESKLSKFTSLKKHCTPTKAYVALWVIGAVAQIAIVGSMFVEINKMSE